MGVISGCSAAQIEDVRGLKGWEQVWALCWSWKALVRLRIGIWRAGMDWNWRWIVSFVGFSSVLGFGEQIQLWNWEGEVKGLDGIEDWISSALCSGPVISPWPEWYQATERTNSVNLNLNLNNPYISSISIQVSQARSARIQGNLPLLNSCPFTIPIRPALNSSHWLTQLNPITANFLLLNSCPSPVPIWPALNSSH